eukprot:gene8602-34043_t
MPPGSGPPAPAVPRGARAGSRPPSSKRLLEELRKEYSRAQALLKNRQSTCFTVIGNAVSPLMARSIGRCFSLAAVKACPPDQAILTQQAYREAEQRNLRPFCEEVNRAKEEKEKVKKIKGTLGVTSAVEEEEEEDGEDDEEEEEGETEEDRGFNGFSAGPALFANSNSADDEEAERQATRSCSSLTSLDASGCPNLRNVSEWLNAMLPGLSNG